jgi:hypothetical protein
MSEREQFEAWFRSRYQMPEYVEIRIENTPTEDMWHAWQDRARIAAPVDEVEPRFFMDHGLWHDRETGQHLWTQAQYDDWARANYRAGAEDHANGALPAWAKAKIKAQPAQEPAGWRDFLVRLSHMDGSMVNGNRLSIAARELLDAAPRGEGN